ncbi:MAG: peptidoglycan DD-metalloendopeptidase family protein [Candidatus Aminicenantes bacterium]|nr:peptidoglycan DD-metalloendopeptidase family protein [Candidatus Aminicenantes bacterium]
MKRIFFLFFSVFFLGSSSLFSFQREYLRSSSGATLELTYRALEPGEVILVSLKDASSAEEVTLWFQGKDYPLKKDSANLESFAFIGLDLGTEPGMHMMKVLVMEEEGTWEYIQKEIPIAVKEFPERTLWVDERFVTPPPWARERIKIEAEILTYIYGVYTPRWLGEGEFILPTADDVAPNFGERRIFNNNPRSPHSGVDISSPYGTSVKASNSGKVVLAKELYFAGQTVIIDHGLGLFTHYLHLSSLRVKRGEWVKKGAVIGEVGATGRVTGPHLHWGIRLLGARVDPFSLLSLSWEE